MKSEEGIYQFENMQSEEPSQAPNNSGGTPAHRFMIAGEAPVLLGKACELMIREVTKRAWSHTEKSRRRTLQRQDVHAAVAESDVYDFLIDIVPRVNISQPAQGVPPPPDQLSQTTFTPMNVSGIASTSSNNPALNNQTNQEAQNNQMLHITQMQEQMNNAAAAQAAALTQTNIATPMLGAYPGQIYLLNPAQMNLLQNVTTNQQQQQLHQQTQPQQVQQNHQIQQQHIQQQQIQQQVQHVQQQQAQQQQVQQAQQQQNIQLQDQQQQQPNNTL